METNRKAGTNKEQEVRKPAHSVPKEVVNEQVSVAPSIGYGRSVFTPLNILAFQRTIGNRAVQLALQHHSDGVLQRAPKGNTPAKTADDEAAGLGFRGDVTIAEADTVMQAATEFQKRATGEMGSVHARVVQYLNTYRLAHDDISKRLGKARAEAARSDAMKDAVLSIVAGTGVGVILPRLIDGYRKMRTVGLLSKKTVKELTRKGQAVVEATGETVELEIGKLWGSDPKPFEIPPELSADLVASQQWQQLAEGWKRLAEAALGITEFGNARYDLFRELNKPHSTEELRAILDGWTKRDVLGQMRQAITEADDAIAEFTTVMDSPLLDRNQYVLSQELLIKWMVSLAPDPKNVHGKDLDPIDDMETVLAEFGIIAGTHWPAPADATRLGVDFGPWWTSTADQVKAYESAVYEKRRLGYIGRLGAIFMRGPLTLVRLSHKAYAVTGRPDPAPNDLEWTMPAVNSEMEPLQEGQVVIVTSLLPGHERNLDSFSVVVKPVKGAPNVPQIGPVLAHPRTVRREEARQRKEEEERQKPPSSVPIDPIRAAEQEYEELFGPMPPWTPQQEPQAQANDQPVFLAPDEYDTTISPDDPDLDPATKKVCFGDEDEVAQ